MSTEQIKAELVKFYPGDKWAQRVKGMSAPQAAATFARLSNKQFNTRSKK